MAIMPLTFLLMLLILVKPTAYLLMLLMLTAVLLMLLMPTAVLLMLTAVLLMLLMPTAVLLILMTQNSDERPQTPLVVGGARVGAAACCAVALW